MAALAADVNVSFIGSYKSVPLSANAADTYYKGAIVYIDTGGGVQVTAAAGDRPVGIVPYKQVITAAAQSVEVVVDALVWLPVGTNIAAADEGDYLVNDGPTDTDNPADLVAGLDITAAANDAVVGKILKVTSTQMLVSIHPSFTGHLYVATAGWGG